MAKELINDSALIRLYQNVLEEDPRGNEQEVKMQATHEFRRRLNDFMFDVVSSCIQHARAAGRLTLNAIDIPPLGEHPPDPNVPVEEEITLVK